jgi:hypothetical protein
MASDAGSARATNGMWVTSQVTGGTSDNADAMTAPGTVPAGPDYPESSPSLHNDPKVATISTSARHLVRGGGEAS